MTVHMPVTWLFWLAVLGVSLQATSSPSCCLLRLCGVPCQPLPLVTCPSLRSPRRPLHHILWSIVYASMWLKHWPQGQPEPEQELHSLPASSPWNGAGGGCCAMGPGWSPPHLVSGTHNALHCTALCARMIGSRSAHTLHCTATTPHGGQPLCCAEQRSCALECTCAPPTLITL